MSSDSDNEDYQNNEQNVRHNSRLQKPIGEELPIQDDKNSTVADNFLELFQNDQVEIARVEDRETERAAKVDKTAFSEQALQKMKLKQIAVLLQDFGWDDRYEWLNYMKNKANNLAREKKYDQAIQVYMESAVGIDLRKEQSEEQLEIMKKDFQVTILSNLAICYKKKQQYEQALTFHRMAIEIDPKDTKQIIKRAYTYFDAGKYDLAIKDCNLAQSLKTRQDQDQVEQDTKIINQRIQALNQQEKQVYQKMFSKPIQEEERKDEPSEEEKNNLLEHPKKVMEIEHEEIITKKNKYVNMIFKGWDFLIRVFGCKRLFVDEDDEEDINSYKQDPDYSEEFNFPQRQDGNFIL